MTHLDRDLPGLRRPAPKLALWPCAALLAACWLAMPATPSHAGEAKEAKEAGERSERVALLSRYRQFSAHGYYTAAQYLFEQKKNEEAIALYTKAIEIDPKFARAYFDRGNVYAEVGDNAKALADCKKVTELDATLIYGHFNLACFYSLQGMLPESLAAMETAMQAGYRKFDKIDTDSDLENVRRKPEFAKLVEKYKAQTPKLTAPQVFQTSSAAQRAAMLADAASLSKAEALRVAELGFSDPDVRVRVLSVACFATLDSPQSESFLLMGLYDNDGYVKKAAANRLIALGKRAEALVLPIFDLDNAQAKFYSIQILGAIGAEGSIARIIPFLDDEDSVTRGAAAEALAKLNAVEALPQITKALERLEKAKDPDAEMERIRLEMAKGHLEEQAKKKGGN
jgi:tetratricopeptide (TPR) repeat protein